MDICRAITCNYSTIYGVFIATSSMKRGKLASGFSALDDDDSMVSIIGCFIQHCLTTQRYCFITIKGVLNDGIIGCFILTFVAIRLAVVTVVPFGFTTNLITNSVNTNRVPCISSLMNDTERSIIQGRKHGNGSQGIHIGVTDWGCITCVTSIFIWGIVPLRILIALY